MTDEIARCETEEQWVARIEAAGYCTLGCTPTCVSDPIQRLFRPGWDEYYKCCDAHREVSDLQYVLADIQRSIQADAPLPGVIQTMERLLSRATGEPVDLRFAYSVAQVAEAYGAFNAFRRRGEYAQALIDEALPGLYELVRQVTEARGYADSRASLTSVRNQTNSGRGCAGDVYVWQYATTALGVCAVCVATGHVGDCPGHSWCPRCDRHDRPQAECDTCDYHTGRARGLSAGVTSAICSSCCTCETCQDCEVRVESSDFCRECGSCREACCECERCAACGDVLDPRQFCGCGSGECRDCCGCGGTAIPRKTFKLLKFEAAKVNKKTKLRRLLGTEIEIADSPGNLTALKVALERWKTSVTNDGSLPNTGTELVTQPAGGDQWHAMIEDLCAGLSKADAIANYDCGLHVHVDATSLNIWDMRRVIKLYAAVETALYSCIHPYRGFAPRGDSDHYSQPCGQTYLDMINQSGKWSKSAAMKAQYREEADSYKSTDMFDGRAGRYVKPKDDPRKHEQLVMAQLKEVAKHKYHNTRYRGLNMHSYWLRGTIEFRHHHGTVKAENIINWGTVCGSIVEWAASKSDAELNRLIGKPATVIKDVDESMAILERVVRDCGSDDAVKWLKARRAFFKTFDPTPEWEEEP